LRAGTPRKEREKEGGENIELPGRREAVEEWRLGGGGGLRGRERCSDASLMGGGE